MDTACLSVLNAEQQIGNKLNIKTMYTLHQKPMREAYYKATPKTEVDGYIKGESYKCVIKPLFSGKLAIFKSVMAQNGVEFPNHMGYKTFPDEVKLKESFDVVML